ncbi:MAG: hypothetical protein EXR85_07535 [Xanthomonadales bacterium]|nr:hypothetical protein [Xanthomonadales bacterium]
MERLLSVVQVIVQWWLTENNRLQVSVHAWETCLTQIKAGATAPRLTRQAGDFFKDKLPVCDAYLVMEVIHDWSDAESISILQAIRRAAPSHARLLLIEEIVPDDPGPAWSKMLDIHMLALIGGKQRTRREYEALFDAAGLSFQREIDTGAGISILQAA